MHYPIHLFTFVIVGELCPTPLGYFNWGGGVDNITGGFNSPPPQFLPCIANVLKHLVFFCPDNPTVLDRTCFLVYLLDVFGSYFGEVGDE